jgi:hemerythrin-like domain-containing protein
LTSETKAFDADIDRRTGWPDELRVLLKAYPRDSWPQTATPMARFWLDRHDYFRHETLAVQTAVRDYREQQLAPFDLARRVVYRLQVCLSHLHGHHQLEDFHYFPAFRAAEKRLAGGFDVLAQDHESLHESIGRIADKMNVLSRTNQESDEQRRAADEFSDANELLYRRLGRHLDDEEDLIIPILLAHGQ